MKTIDLQGNSLQEIITQFRKEYQIRDWELRYEVISQPSSGFLGLGKRPAILRFTLLTTEERIKLYMEQLLTHLGIKYENLTIKIEQKTFYVTIHKTSDAGFLIGKNGTMLEQLQYLVNRVFEHVHGLERIYLDTEDYRSRQEQAFIRPFIPLIQQVKTTGKSITLDPMQPAERRIIHRYVESERSLKTMTIGEGDKKRIVILPATQPEEKAPAEKAKPEREHRRTERTKPRPERQTPPPEPETPKPEKEAPKPDKEPEPELTYQQRAAEAYQRHNEANPTSRPAKYPKSVSARKR